MAKHPVLYKNPSPSQTALVNVTMDVDTLQEKFPKVFDLLVKNTEMCWPEWSEDDRKGAKTPLDYAKASEDSFIIVPLESDMAQAFTPEDYVQPIPGHMALFMENNGFTNITLVFIKDGLIG